MWSAVALSLAVCAGVSEEAARQLWEAAVARARDVAAFVPAHVESRTEVLDGSGEPLGAVREVRVLRGQKDGRPDWEVQEETTGKPDIGVKLRLTARSTPFAAAAEGRLTLRGASWEDAGGRCLVRYEFVERAEDRDGKESLLEGTAWLDAASGAPQRVRYRKPSPPRPVKAWELTLSFAVDGSPGPLPETAELRMTGQYLLWKRTVIVSQRLEQWQRVP